MLGPSWGSGGLGFRGAGFQLLAVLGEFIEQHLKLLLVFQVFWVSAEAVVGPARVPVHVNNVFGHFIGTFGRRFRCDLSTATLDVGVWHNP